MMIHFDGKAFAPYISNDEIEQAISRIALQIDADYADASEPPVLLGILNGAFMFCASLCRRLRIPTYVEFLKVSSYVGEKSTYNHQLAFPLHPALKRKHFIIVEDIWDTGTTCAFVDKYIRKNAEPLSVKIACLFIKPEASKVNSPSPSYVGISIPKDFVIGYGLDYNGHGRYLDSLYKAL